MNWERNWKEVVVAELRHPLSGGIEENHENPVFVW
jgi:hypothetical protein